MPDPTYYNLATDISENVKGGVIPESEKTEKISFAPPPTRYCVSFCCRMNVVSIKRYRINVTACINGNDRNAGDFEGVVFREQRRNNETKIETVAGEWAGVFSRRNFYSVLSVHVYGIYFVVTGPGYCVLGARAGIIPDTSDGDVWAARYEMVRWASVGLYYLCPT